MTEPQYFETPGYGAIAASQYNYSQALRIGDRIEISGQGGWDEDFAFSARSLEEEIGKAFDNVESTLAVAGAGWSDVVMVRSYHVPTAGDAIGSAHMSATVEQLRERMGDHLPLWTAIGVQALGLPEMHVEIEVVAVISTGA